MAHIPDAVEATIQQVLEQGGHVEIVTGHTELAQAGVGVSLRY
jgi:hypothetical protein